MDYLPRPSGTQADATTPVARGSEGLGFGVKGLGILGGGGLEI